jgi:hypothetical protein
VLFVILERVWFVMSVLYFPGSAFRPPSTFADTALPLTSAPVLMVTALFAVCQGAAFLLLRKAISK